MPRYCPDCNASSPSRSLRCTACGRVLPAPAADEPTTAAPRPGGSPIPSPPPLPARGAASPRPRFRHQLASGRRAVLTVRSIFLVLALLGLVGCLVNGLAWRQLDPELEAEQRGALGLAALLLGSVFVTACLGIARAAHNPLPWAVGAAGLLTIQVGMHVADGRFPGVAMLGFTLAAWGAVVPILRLGRLRQEHPEIEELRDLHGKPTAQQRARARSKWRALWLEFRTAGIVFVIFVVGLVTVTLTRGVISDLLRPDPVSARDIQPDEPIGPFLARFELAWRSSDAKALQPLFLARLRSRATRLDAVLERGGFRAPFPELRDRTARNVARMRQAVQYTTDVGDVQLVVEFADGAWGIQSFRLP